MNLKKNAGVFFVIFTPWENSIFKDFKTVQWKIIKLFQKILQFTTVSVPGGLAKC